MAKRWWLVVPLAACTGLGIGELAALSVVDLNLAAREVRVRGTAVGVSKNGSGRDRRRQEHLPQTTAGERTVPTSTDEVADRLAHHIAERGLGLRDLWTTGRQRGSMMPDNLAPSHLEHRGGQSHGGRSTAYAALAQAHRGRVVDWCRADKLTVARWAGHTDNSFTERVYGHLWERDHTDTRAAIAELLSGGSVLLIRMAK
jgi:integrase